MPRLIRRPLMEARSRYFDSTAERCAFGATDAVVIAAALDVQTVSPGKRGPVGTQRRAAISSETCQRRSASASSRPCAEVRATLQSAQYSPVMPAALGCAAT